MSDLQSTSKIKQPNDPRGTLPKRSCWLDALLQSSRSTADATAGQPGERLIASSDIKLAPTRGQRAFTGAYVAQTA